jgi:hypothetical protein
MSWGQCILITLHCEKTYITTSKHFLISLEVQNFIFHNYEGFEHTSSNALYINEIKDGTKLETMTEKYQTCCHKKNFFRERITTDCGKQETCMNSPNFPPSPFIPPLNKCSMNDVSDFTIYTKQFLPWKS